MKLMSLMKKKFIQIRDTPRKIFMIALKRKGFV